jgi:20S proteasome subunit beta 7
MFIEERGRRSKRGDAATGSYSTTSSLFVSTAATAATTNQQRGPDSILFLYTRRTILSSLLLLLLLCVIMSFTTGTTFANTAHTAGTRQHTTRPMVTGTSVLGLVYDGGVLLAADTQLSYGSMSKAQNAQRLTIIENTSTVVGASGEYSDYQKILEILQQKALEETTTGLMCDVSDTETLTAENTWNYLRMLMYAKRNKHNPFWNDLVVAGLDGAGKPFLGMVDKIGTTVKDNFLATGFGGYLALPLLREKWRPDLSEGEARALLEDCMKVLFYRDCRASARIQLAKCSAEDGSVLVSEPYTLETVWDNASFQASSGGMEDDGGW